MPIATIRRPVVNHRPAVENPTKFAEKMLENGRVSVEEMRHLLQATGATRANSKNGTVLDPQDGELLRKMYDISLNDPNVTFHQNAFDMLLKAMRAFDLLAVTPINPPALSVLTPARQRLILDAVDNLVAQNGADKFNGHLPLPAGSSYSRHEIVDGLRKLIVIIPTGGAVVSGASQDANDPNNANVVGVEVHENGVTNHVWHIAQLNLAAIGNAPPVTIGNNPPAMRVPLSKEQLLDGFKAVGGFKKPDASNGFKPYFTPMAEAPAAVEAALNDVIPLNLNVRSYLEDGHMSFGCPFAVVDPADGQLKGLVFRARSATDLAGFAFATTDQMAQQPV